jgi:hypothetical protein
MDLFGNDSVQWRDRKEVESASWDCGYCGNRVSSTNGWAATVGSSHLRFVRICPDCRAPTFFDRREAPHPSAPPGKAVEHVPNEVRTVYEEARKSAAAGAYTAAVLVCRKILMHIAVEEGAEAGKNFVSYIEYLADQGFVPPHGKDWVDYIRRRGNEATHEIVVMSKEDAWALIGFVELLLRFIYEFPQLVPTTTPPGGGATT